MYTLWYVHTYVFPDMLCMYALYVYDVLLSVHTHFTDQTPTPTRFLKICDQEGLFDTLKDNPFDHVRFLPEYSEIIAKVPIMSHLSLTPGIHMYG